MFLPVSYAGTSASWILAWDHLIPSGIESFSTVSFALLAAASSGLMFRNCCPTKVSSLLLGAVSCLVFHFISVDSVLARSEADAAARHPIIDAFVASGVKQASPLKLSDLMRVSKCSRPTETAELDVDALIPEIVTIALEGAILWSGRILEYSG